LRNAACMESLAGSPAYTPDTNGSMILRNTASPRWRLMNSWRRARGSGRWSHLKQLRTLERCCFPQGKRWLKGVGSPSPPRTSGGAWVGQKRRGHKSHGTVTCTHPRSHTRRVRVRGQPKLQFSGRVRAAYLDRLLAGGRGGHEPDRADARAELLQGVQQLEERRILHLPRARARRVTPA